MQFIQKVLTKIHKTNKINTDYQRRGREVRKINLKSQKGITLVILILTLAILSILATVSIIEFDSGVDIRNYNYMCADIELLEDKILVYYNNNGTLPIKGEAIVNIKSMLEGQASSRDNDNYYQIDVSKINNITLNFGGGDLSNKNIYIINEQSHEVYYLKGVVFEGTTYYTPFN